MFMPPLFAEEDSEQILQLVRSSGFGHLVYAGADGPESTPFPFVIDDGMQSIRAHLARANPLWKQAPDRVLAIVPVTDAYISPGWYPSKAEHGKVVPTWNYEVVHLHGRLEVHDDITWIARQVEALTDHNEAPQSSPWAVSDAPTDFIDKQLRAIVGLEIHVDRIEAKQKLSQNREAADHDGAMNGLASQGSGSADVAASMRVRLERAGER